MARLDRLAAVKEVARLGAALGRTFPYELLHAVASVDETTLQRSLARLVEAELLYQRGVPPDATYIFKHALIQETAYQSMLMSRSSSSIRGLPKSWPDNSRKRIRQIRQHQRLRERKITGEDLYRLKLWRDYTFRSSRV